MLNRTQVLSMYAGSQRQLPEERRHKARPQWPQPHDQAICHGLLDGWIHRLQDHRIRGRLRLGKDGGRSAKRNADDADMLAGQFMSQVFKRSRYPRGFPCAKSDSVTRALAVGRQVHQQRGIACLVEEASSPDHLGSVSSYSVQEQNGSLSWLTACKPSNDRSTGRGMQANA